MKIARFVVTVCVVLCAGSHAWCQDKAAGDAWVFKIENAASVVKAGATEKTPLKAGVWLKKGDFASTEAKSAAYLLMNNGDVMFVPENSGYTVGEAAAVSKPEVTSFWAKLVSIVSSDRSASTRGLHSSAATLEIMPHSGNLLAPLVMLRWNDPKASADSTYAVTIQEDSGAAKTATLTVNGKNGIEITQDRFPLAAGKSYIWTLSTNTPGQVQRGTFRVLSPEDAAKAKAAMDKVRSEWEGKLNPAVMQVGLALQYVENQLPLEAYSCFQKAIEQDPANNEYKHFQKALFASPGNK